VIVGPGYFYFKGRTNRLTPTGRAAAAQQQQQQQGQAGDDVLPEGLVDPDAAVLGGAGGGGGADREWHDVLHLFHLKGEGFESPLLMANRWQTLFVQVGSTTGAALCCAVLCCAVLCCAVLCCHAGLHLAALC